MIGLWGYRSIFLVLICAIAASLVVLLSVRVGDRDIALAPAVQGA